MAKKKTKTPAESVREALDQAFQSPVPRERVQEILDELGSAASRLRGAMEELRPASADDVKVLRAELDALGRRVAALERKPAPRARAASASKTGAAKTGAAAKAPAARRAAAARKPAA